MKYYIGERTPGYYAIVPYTLVALSSWLLINCWIASIP